MSNDHTNLIEHYGVKPGQVYHRADGTDPNEHHLVVADITTFAECDDVLVYDVSKGVKNPTPRRIDAFKLAMVRYYLSK